MKTSSLGVEVYDTTLRDGSQRAGISLSCDDKVRIARVLDRLGVAFIEGGWPGSNPKDAEFFARARDVEWTTARIAAFGSTRRVGHDVEDDPNLRALLESGTTVCTLFGKTSPLHVLEVIRSTLEDNLTLIEESVAYLRGEGRDVIYDAEHFFDGYKVDPVYAVETLRAADRGGARTLVLCDTNGGCLPWEVETMTRDVRASLAGEGDAAVPRLGAHMHNDADCAVANSVAAIRSGATHLQGTINGYGERCGNADLCTAIPSLELKLGRHCLPPESLKHLPEVARFVAEVANLALDDCQPYVGRHAFAHKGGVHVAATRRNRNAYQHVDPAEIGNETRVLVSELSGRGNVLCKAEEYAAQLGGDVAGILEEIKANEARGFCYEAAEGSVAVMLARQEADYCPPFRLIDYMVNVEHRDRRGTFAEATVKLEVEGGIVHTAAEGVGPVGALDKALRKALLPIYPALSRFKLVDYKVRILDGDKATAATTRVLIDTSDGERSWGTVGASSNMIEASWGAMADAIEYGLRLHGVVVEATGEGPQRDENHGNNHCSLAG